MKTPVGSTVSASSEPGDTMTSHAASAAPQPGTLQTAAPWTAQVLRWGLVAGGAGALLTLLGVTMDPRRAAAAYLVAYTSALAIVLGALAMLMIGHVVRATWFVVLRRSCEDVSAVLPWLALLIIPVFVAIPLLYPWGGSATGLSAADSARLAAREPWFNISFVIGRAVLYFAIWMGLSMALRHWSLRQDHAATDAEALTLSNRQRVTSAVGLTPYAFAVTFAAFDWLMSLSVEFYSTVYGLEYWSGGLVAALALLAVMLVPLGKVEGPAAPEGAATAEHSHALGKLLLTFVIFWAYMIFSQLIVIWSADLPAEAVFYASRFQGWWAVAGIAVVVGNFVVPFLLLLLRDVKRYPRVLAMLGVWLLVFHWLDVQWLVMPSLYPEGFPIHWLDLTAIAAVWGSCAAMLALRHRGHAPVPAGDPRLAASVVYQPDS